MIEHEVDIDNLDLRQIQAAYLSVLETDAGKIVLADMKRTYDDATSHVPGDSYATAFNEGQRNVYLTIISTAKAAIEERKQLTREGKDNA